VRNGNEQEIHLPQAAGSLEGGPIFSRSGIFRIPRGAVMDAIHQQRGGNRLRARRWQGANKWKTPRGKAATTTRRSRTSP
jgi:hypothetical protein